MAEGVARKETEVKDEGVGVARSNAERTEDKHTKPVRSKAEKLLDEMSALSFGRCRFLNLFLAEYYIHSGKSHQANLMIDALRQNVTILGPGPVEVMRCAEEFFDNLSFARAMILYRIACDVIRTLAWSPDNLVDGIHTCMVGVYCATKALTEAGGRSRKIGVEYGVEFLIEMHSYLKAVEDVKNLYRKVEFEARSCHYIECSLAFGKDYCSGKEYEKRLKYLNAGLKTLEEHCGANASKCKVYGYLLHNLGLHHNKLDEFAEAEVYFLKAFKALEEAEDFDDEAEKRKLLQLSMTKWKKTSDKLAKTAE